MTLSTTIRFLCGLVLILNTSSFHSSFHSVGFSSCGGARTPPSSETSFSFSISTYRQNNNALASLSQKGERHTPLVAVLSGYKLY